MTPVVRSLFLYSGAMILLSIVGVACSEETEWLGDPGDPCRSLRTECVSDERVLLCRDEIWVEADCAVICGEQSVGLASQGCVVDNCVCAPPVDGCTPGEQVCGDLDVLHICSTDWTWETRECEDICSERSPQNQSQGCHVSPEEADFCLCTSEGAECTEGQVSFCAGQATLAECVDSVWLYTNCTAGNTIPTVCDPSALPYPACRSL